MSFPSTKVPEVSTDVNSLLMIFSSYLTILILLIQERTLALVSFSRSDFPIAVSIWSTLPTL